MPGLGDKAGDVRSQLDGFTVSLATDSTFTHTHNL